MIRFALGRAGAGDVVNCSERSTTDVLANPVSSLEYASVDRRISNMLGQDCGSIDDKKTDLNLVPTPTRVEDKFA